MPGDLRRFVIKYALIIGPVTRSRGLNHFTLEGCEAGGYLNGDYHDVNMYLTLLMRIKGNRLRGTRNTILAIDHFWAAQVNSIAVKAITAARPLISTRCSIRISCNIRAAFQSARGDGSSKIGPPRTSQHVRLPAHDVLTQLPSINACSALPASCQRKG